MWGKQNNLLATAYSEKTIACDEPGQYTLVARDKEKAVEEQKVHTGRKTCDKQNSRDDTNWTVPGSVIIQARSASE